MELYEYARPDIMSGKKILYLHGFASSGQNGTVKTMGTLLPSAEIIAPDIPVEPVEAMDMLKKLCEAEKPDLIIGASMGAMYAEMLRGYDRILVNPAFKLADTILKNNGLGRQEFHNPRRDGQTSFLVNKGLIEAFREVSSHNFEGLEPDSSDPVFFGKVNEEKQRVYGMFGIHDTLVTGTFELFSTYYPNAIRFNGEHYLDDSVFLHSVMPVIERIDDKQENRAKKVMLIALTDTLLDMTNGQAHGLAIEDMEPFGSAVKAFAKLSEQYSPYVLISNDFNAPERLPELYHWVEKRLGVPAWNRVVIANKKDMLLGDYLIDRYPERLGTDDFMGTVLHFGEEPFKTWEEVLTYFSRLGGQ